MRNGLQCLGRSQGTCSEAVISIAERTQSYRLVDVDVLLKGWQWRKGSSQGPGTTW